MRNAPSDPCRTKKSRTMADVRLCSASKSFGTADMVDGVSMFFPVAYSCFSLPYGHAQEHDAPDDSSPEKMETAHNVYRQNKKRNTVRQDSADYAEIPLQELPAMSENEALPPSRSGYIGFMHKVLSSTDYFPISRAVWFTSLPRNAQSRLIKSRLPLARASNW